MILTEETRRTRKEVCSRASLSNTNLTLTGLGLNSRFRSRLNGPAELRHADVHQKYELLMSLDRWKMVEF